MSLPVVHARSRLLVPKLNMMAAKPFAVVFLPILFISVYFWEYEMEIQCGKYTAVVMCCSVVRTMWGQRSLKQSAALSETESACTGWVSV